MVALQATLAHAGPFGSETSVGVLAQYDSNPYFMPTAPQSAESLALVATLPLTYTGAASTFDLRARGRFARSRGIAALLSDYQYLDTVWQHTGERGGISLNGAWYRDSTLYNNFESSALQSRTLRKQEATASFDLNRQTSERDTVHLTGSFDHLRYGKPVPQSLENYDYGQVAASFDRDLSERWQGSWTVGAGRYKAGDRDFRSDQIFTQLGLNRILAERWSLSAQVGYSHLKDREVRKGPFIVFGPNGLEIVPELTERSKHGTAVYTLGAQRRDTRSTWSLEGSRALKPSGLGGLLTEDTISLSQSSDWSERLNLTTALQGSRISDSLGRVILGDRRFLLLQFKLAWRAGERWTIESQLAGNLRRLDGQRSHDVGIYLSVLRRFDRLGSN